MTPQRSTEYVKSIVRELRQLPHEVEWVEFKENNVEPQMIGEYISALANAAALEGRVAGYLLWGVRDGDHQLVGTSFRPTEAKKGAEPLENWLLRLLEPKIDFDFHELTIDDFPVVLLEITPATHKPVRFSGREYIRIGSAKKPLQAAPERERRLWRIFDRAPFEQMIAAERLDAGQVLLDLDYGGDPFGEESRSIPDLATQGGSSRSLQGKGASRGDP